MRRPDVGLRGLLGYCIASWVLIALAAVVLPGLCATKISDRLEDSQVASPRVIVIHHLSFLARLWRTTISMYRSHISPLHTAPYKLI